jgi:uncharacterized membrane protein YtjA (UPF0391 family)
MSIFRTVALVFLVLWLVGFFGFYQAVSSFIHSLILLAIVFFVVDLLTSRRRAI